MSKVFNDSIHGRIKIPDYCISIIDTLEFQRLRNLKQLGLTSYVFYGATHTRFEHSIGVSWLAGQWVKHLQKKHPEENITKDDIKMIRLAGLLHDIGHGPFSHTFERFIRITRPDITYSHEDMTINIIERLDINSSLKENIIKIIKGITLESKPYLGHIIHNTVNGLDADKLDYFIRDSQCASFAIASDWNRIVYESSIKDNSIVFPYKLVGDVFNVYQTRFRLYKEVYYHKTVSKIEDIFIDALVKSDKLGLTNLGHSIDSVDSFLLVQDDIMGIMERLGLPEIVDIKTRNFKGTESTEGTEGQSTEGRLERIAHYGMGEQNPLLFVRFIDVLGNYVEIPKDVINTMCPLKFSISLS